MSIGELKFNEYGMELIQQARVDPNNLLFK